MPISSQAPQECGEGSTTRAYDPDRVMGLHERATTKTCTQCRATKPVERFSERQSWCKDCINAYSKKHYQRRRPHVLALKVSYRASNKDKISKLNAEWRERNLDRQRDYLRAYRQAKRGKINSLEARRHAAKLKATPKWANLKHIERIYTKAKRISKETGVRQSVDHIYPLRGKTVSGLHVPENLRIIPLVDNCKKRNKMPVEDIV